MKVKRIHHVAVQTNSLDKSLDFYVGILGADLIERRKFKSRDFAWLSIGEVKIELYSKRENDDLNKWDDYFCGPVHLAFIVDNLNEFLKEVLKKGALFHPSHPEPFTPPVPNAKQIAYLLGPDEEEVEIREE